jgi:hypothetical protein
MYSAALLLAFFLRVGAAQPSCWAYPYCLSNTMKAFGSIEVKVISADLKNVSYKEKLH